MADGILVVIFSGFVTSLPLARILAVDARRRRAIEGRSQCAFASPNGR